MSKPTKVELGLLRSQQGDDEAYHAAFDALLEEKLLELDPEWLGAVKQEYADSGMKRWAA